MIRKMAAVSVMLMLGAVAFGEEVKVDLSTPKGAAKAVTQKVFAGDLEGAKKLFAEPANDKEKALLADGWSDDVYGPPMFAALKEKFPDANLPNFAKMSEYTMKAIDKMDEKIDGDTATLSMPPSTNPVSGPVSESMKFKKVGGEWKLAIEEGRFLRTPPSAEFKELAAARKAAKIQFTADVKAGKFKTYEEAKAEMDKRQKEVQEKFTKSAPK